MQRWFYADELEVCEKPTEEAEPSDEVVEEEELPPITYRPWTFKVKVQLELWPNEKIAIVGSTQNLGMWQLDAALVMKKYLPNKCRGIEDEPNIWWITVDIPFECPTQYRYFICAVDPCRKHKIVRRWETHLKPREITAEAMPVETDLDLFGHLDNKYKVERGWLTKETLVQFTFYEAPFCLEVKNRPLYVKVTPLNTDMQHGCENRFLYDPTDPRYPEEEYVCDAEEAGECLEEAQLLEECEEDPSELARIACSAKNRKKGKLSTAFAFHEVTKLNIKEYELHNQPKYGTLCAEGDIVMLHMTIGDFANACYMVNLYTWSSKAASDELPYHFGYYNVRRQELTESEGELSVPIMCATMHRAIGTMNIKYLIIKPMKNYQTDMRVSYLRHWNPKWRGLDIGHRGSGANREGADEGCTARQNTIASFKYAAANGADMVEFDVQVSKDLVPVIHHDFALCLSLTKENELATEDCVDVPLHSLTWEQLQKLTPGRFIEDEPVPCNPHLKKRCIFERPTPDNKLCPKLEEVLLSIHPHIGFNVEIKWPQLLAGVKRVRGHPNVIDINLYVDLIIDVVRQKAGNRRIVFSSFSADICMLLRFKQNMYPVMFITFGKSEDHKHFLDKRCANIEMVTYTALAMEFLGVTAHAQDLLNDPILVNLVLGNNLVLFCWGKDCSNEETLDQLKTWGAHGVIYDKMQVYNKKLVKKSVFQLEAEALELKNLICDGCVPVREYVCV